MEVMLRERDQCHGRLTASVVAWKEVLMAKHPSTHTTGPDSFCSSRVELE